MHSFISKVRDAECISFDPVLQLLFIYFGFQSLKLSTENDPIQPMSESCRRTPCAHSSEFKCLLHCAWGMPFIMSDKLLKWIHSLVSGPTIIMMYGQLKNTIYPLRQLTIIRAMHVVHKLIVQHHWSLPTQGDLSSILREPPLHGSRHRIWMT